MSSRLVIGCMTGTSLDGLDVSLVEIEGTGLAMRATPKAHAAVSLGAIGPRLRVLASQEPTTAGDLAGLMLDFAQIHVDAIAGLLAGSRPDLIGVHGQTVFHKPPRSWQMFQPAPLARAFACPVVCDFRSADLAAGGQGAPITPIADWVLYRGLGTDDAGRVDLVNLGGFCNVTSLTPSEGTAPSPETVRAMDVCACNQILDAAARTVLRVPFDEGGAAAASGKIHDEALEDLLGVMRAQRAPGRSLGTGDELSDWIARQRHALTPNDLVHTACAGVAETIAEDLAALPGTPGVVGLAGGGVRNMALVGLLTSACPGVVRVLPSAASREADCFAVLAALCQDRVPITLPHVTGCTTPAPLSGLWCLP
jgi:anhydro-N-acetylmuramic acid kinase